MYIGLLSRVCKTWRNIVLTYPGLWSDVQLHIHTIPFTIQAGTSKFRPELMILALERSQNHPLTISLTATDLENNTKFEKAFEILHGASERWSDIRLDGHLLYLMVQRNPTHWIARNRPMHLLQKLTLLRARHCDSLLGTLMGLSSGDLPSLTHLTLELYSGISSLAGKESSRGFPWSQLTHLCLKDGAVNAWMEKGSIDDFLRQIPNIQDLTIAPLFNSARRGKPAAVLRRLKTFSFTLEYGIGTTDESALSSALSFVKAPNLENLKVSIYSERDVKIAEACIPPFLERSGCTLKRVSLIGFGEALATSTLQMMPTIESLYMSTHGDPMPLQCLAWIPDKPNILPALTTLTLDGMAVAQRNSLIQVIQSRLPSHSGYEKPAHHPRPLHQHHI